jgi:hypothetical protein
LRVRKLKWSVALAKNKCAQKNERDAVDSAQSNCNKYKLNFELAIFAEKRLTFLGRALHAPERERQVYIVHLDRQGCNVRARRTYTPASPFQSKKLDAH